MNRKEFFQKSLQAGLGTCCVLSLNPLDYLAKSNDNQPDDINAVKQEKEFIQNWLTDLLETIDTQLDEKTKIKLIEGCGKGCYRRHEFKHAIAKAGEGSVDKLIEAYKQSFEIWRDGDVVHIRYGEISPGCYCPAARYRPAKPNDLHCNCTKATHQSIWEAALGRTYEIDILETVRRGGKTCHFLVHLT
jgi:hypothetical protein